MTKFVNQKLKPHVRQGLLDMALECQFTVGRGSNASMGSVNKLAEKILEHKQVIMALIAAND